MLREFRDFLMRGNLLEIAVGLILLWRSARSLPPS
jgi:large-conductance mechanosensitive channel